MAFVFALLYVMLHLLSPADIYPALAPYRIILALAVVTIIFSIPALLRSPLLRTIPTQLLLVSAFFVWVAMSLVPHGWIGSIRFTVTSLTPNFIIYYIAIVQFDKPFKLRILRFGLVLVALYILAMAVSQLPEARATNQQTPYVMAGDIELSTTEARIRGLGILHDPNFYGQFLLLILPLLFVSNMQGGMGVGYLISVPIALLLLVGIYLTNSRGSQLGLILVIGFVLWKKYRKLGAAMAVFLGPVAILAINATRTRTISVAGGVDRLALWSDGLGMFKHSPLWGIGYYEFTNREILTAHNSYLLCLTEVGLIGYFLWLSILIVTIIQLRRVPAAIGAVNPVLARWAEAIKLSLYGYLFTSFFLSRTYDMPLYLLLGMAGGVIAASGGEEKFSLQGSRWPVWAGGLSIVTVVVIYTLVRLRAI